MLQKLESWQDQVAKVQGWRRGLLAFFLGALSVLALPPVHFVLALIPAFVGLVWLIDGSNRDATSNWQHFIRQRFFNGAFAIGWWFGLGFFGAGLYWISFSFLVDAQQFAWMIPFALFGLSGVFAIYIGLVSALCFRLAGPGMRRVFYFAIIWVAFEWVRGWAFTGFPWNLIGTVWTFNEAMIQFASVLGVMGLSLVTMVAASSIAILGYGKKSPRFRYYGAGLPLLILALIWAGGMWRVGSAKNHVVENVQLRLVQPNIKQKNKWKSELRGKHFNNLLELSEAPLREPNGKKPTHIIWPETATPFFLDGNDAALRIMAQIIPKEGALLTGSPRRTGGRGEPVKLWNSLHVVGPDAKISATFDKFHLVPFGEYVPLRDSVGKFINIAKITTGRTDFSSGPGQRALEIPGAPPVSPLICYEVIFPGAATPAHSEGQARPGWLLNITNDAWFGTSSGPYQHLAAAQLRAVEEGLPVIRVANTGISAIIDSYGRIQVASRLSERIYLDGPLPAKLKNPTLFSRNGQWGLLVLILGFLLIAGRRRLD